MNESTEKLTNLKNNSKGFTLIELVVVIAMIVALTTLAGGGFSALSHARAGKAANSLDTLIAQSKVYALSGQENVLVVRYNKDEDEANEFKSKTYYAYLQDSNTGKILDSAELGNYLLTLEYENNGRKTKLSDEGLNEIQLKFDMNNGKLLYCWIGTEAETHEATPSVVKFHVEFASDHIIELYKLTGEHHVVGSET